MPAKRKISSVSSRKPAKHSVSSGEINYRSIFENACEGIYQTTPDGKFLAANPAMARILGFSSPSELIRERTDIARQGYVHPGQREEFKRLLERDGLVSGFECEVRRKNGSTVWVSETARAIRDANGKILFYEGFFEDISERKRAEILRDGQSQILKLIATNAPLKEILTRLIRLIELQTDEMYCSVLLLDKDEKTLRHGAAPSLPEAYNKLTDGIRIGPKAGSCGTAAYRKKPVIVSDIMADSLWAEHRKAARQFNLGACWSTPILSQEGTVLGTFAMYYRKPRNPSAVEKRLIEAATQIAGIAITHKRAEEALLESQALYHSFVEHLPAAVFRKDFKGRYVFVNDIFCRLKGMKAHEILGTTPRELATYEEKIKNKAARQRTMVQGADHHEMILETGKPIELEEAYPQPDGSVEYFYVVKSPVFGPDGRVVGSQGFQFDITARKRAEEQLFNSQHMLRTILDTIPQRVFWKDKNSTYVGCNKQLANDCGYDDPSELIGKDDYETKSAATAEMYRADDRDVMETRKPKLNYEEPQVKADGATGWLRTSKVPLFDKGGNVIGVLGTYEDISDRKRLEEQLRQAQKMDAFGQLAAGVAHDFNNILTVIQGNLSLLRMGLNSKTDETSAIDQALAASERAANLTRQLLTFGRRQPLQPRPLDLNDVMANMTKMLQRLIGEHIALEAHYAPGGAPVYADVNMLEQVLINLAVNSRDAMLKGGKLVVEINSLTLGERDVQTTNKKAGDFVRFSIADNGCGIAPENLPHIFEPFFTTKEVGKGTGLGLATVFGIVQQHDGWVKVESKVGEGTTFHIFLPRLARNISIQSENTSAAKARGGNENILLVEDEPPVRELMRMLLARAGYKIHQAASGNEALKLWSTLHDKIDLLITDMVMPDGISGNELAEKLLAEKSTLKVIYCSGYSDEMLGKNSPLRTNSNFLEKPFEPQKLLKRVRDCLDGL